MLGGVASGAGVDETPCRHGTHVDGDETQHFTQFYDPAHDLHWSCSTHARTGPGRAGLLEAAAWVLTSPCFDDGNVIIVPYRIVDEDWFELDDMDMPIDPDFTAPPMGGDECDGDPPESSAVLEEDLPVIFQAMAMIESAAQIRFVERDPNNPTGCFDEAADPWIRIMRANDCPGYDGNFSQGIGAQSLPGAGTFQEIVVTNWTVGVVAHELLHAIGFFHEQSRSDRDTYIDVLEENISPACLFQYAVGGGVTDFGDYDFYSIMHYSQFACSNNGLPAFEFQPGFEQFEFIVGQRSVISGGDRDGLAHMYGARPDDPCRVDVTGDQFVNGMDLLTFLRWYTSRDPRADWNFDGVINSADLLDFILTFVDANFCQPGPTGGTIYQFGRFTGT